MDTRYSMRALRQRKLTVTCTSRICISTVTDTHIFGGMDIIVEVIHSANCTGKHQFFFRTCVIRSRIFKSQHKSCTRLRCDFAIVYTVFDNTLENASCNTTHHFCTEM